MLTDDSLKRIAIKELEKWGKGAVGWEVGQERPFPDGTYCNMGMGMRNDKKTGDARERG